MFVFFFFLHNCIYVFIFQCNAAVGMKAFFDMMHEGPHKVMLFGAACTQVTDPIAKASKHWRITQVNNNLIFELTHYTTMYVFNLTNTYRYILLLKCLSILLDKNVAYFINVFIYMIYILYTI